ncbi:MAG: ATP-binding cassette domain-containing protein, partial [Alphaproteobacteria bacterium]|nr:ATP-binding cassette domain-containing protein [Alphaproteobacteria bacterium]
MNHAIQTIQPHLDDAFTIPIASHMPPYCRADSLILQKGSIHAMIGPSGVGKTTIIKACLGWCAGQGIVVSYFSQDSILHHNKTVYEHMALLFCLQAKTIPHERITNILQDVGLLEIAHYCAKQLSKGMQQRLQLAMILAQDQALYFLDEPFSSQDRVMRQHLYTLIHKYCADKTVVIATHCTQDLALLCENTIQVQNMNGNLTMTYASVIESNINQAIRQPIHNAAPEPFHIQVRYNMKSYITGTSRLVMIRLGIVGGIMLAWALAIKLNHIPTYVFPSPWDVLMYFKDHGHVLLYHTLDSLWPLFFGGVFATVTSSILGL